MKYNSYQHTMEPQIYFVVFVEPGSINMETMAGEEYYDVVGQGNQDEKSQGSRNKPFYRGKR